MCILVGRGSLALNLPWALALLIPALIACHLILLLPEERYLAAQFSAVYRAYAATVPRWIGRPRPSRMTRDA